MKYKTVKKLFLELGIVLPVLMLFLAAPVLATVSPGGGGAVNTGNGASAGGDGSTNCAPTLAQGQQAQSGCTYTKAAPVPSGDTCGGKVDGQDQSVHLAINIGCKGEGNPIADMTFAIIRILSDGVGLVVIASIIVAGIQYAASQGNPQNTANAVNRIKSSVLALIIFIFGYAILNYIIPKGFLQ